MLTDPEIPPKTETGHEQAILEALADGQAEMAVARLQALKADLYASIPAKRRQSQGITWVVETIGERLYAASPPAQALQVGLALSALLADDDVLQGAPIFMLATVGVLDPTGIEPFFAKAAGSPHWVVREEAAGAFRRVIKTHPAQAQGWLSTLAQATSPNLRRFSSETLRPVVENRWMRMTPEYSLAVLRLLFKEPHPYPRTSVGNNLSDLSRPNPELIFRIVAELMASGDANSAWIAYRACRNLVKKEPLRVLDVLGVAEYHYKDRNFYR